ncbi:unnamed protein product [Effrenium voratum]|nr:unnamed protein product [Effrenium voratum]
MPEEPVVYQVLRMKLCHAWGVPNLQLVSQGGTRSEVECPSWMLAPKQGTVDFQVMFLDAPMAALRAFLARDVPSINQELSIPSGVVQWDDGLFWRLSDEPWKPSKKDCPCPLPSRPTCPYLAPGIPPCARSAACVLRTGLAPDFSCFKVDRLNCATQSGRCDLELSRTR